MPAWICATCGNHYRDQESPPPKCVICADERQWVPSSGQRWTTAAELAGAGHRGDVRLVEPGLLGVGVDPPVAIGQRALVIQTPEGNLLWDPPGFLDEHWHRDLFPQVRVNCSARRVRLWRGERCECCTRES
jgi:hypothetical protein